MWIVGKGYISVKMTEAMFTFRAEVLKSYIEIDVANLKEKNANNTLLKEQREKIIGRFIHTRIVVV